MAQGAILLHKIMRKFTQVDPFLMHAGFGAMCHGHESRDLTLRETRAYRKWQHDSDASEEGCT